SCLDTIDLKVPNEYDDGLVIQGGIFRYKDHAEINVLLSIISDERAQSRIVRVSKIFVENDKGQKVNLNENDDGSYGIFLRPNDFNIDYGTKYKVMAETFGKTVYESSWQELKVSPQIKSLRYGLIKKPAVIKLNATDSTEFVEFYVDTDVKNEKYNYKLKFDIINSYKYSSQIEGDDISRVCYVTQRAGLRNVMLFDGTSSEKESIENLPIFTTQLNYLFSEGYVGTVVMQAVSDSTYSYFNQINELNNREGNIYDPPAGRLITNIKNVSNPNGLAYGFFYAVTQDTARIKISPEAVGNPVRQCPQKPNETTPCPTRSCCDCLILGGSSLNKPPFWN
ncbi:MAG: hypothetical protein RLZZ546_3167, partial [Bacteroidota bacterium]